MLKRIFLFILTNLMVMLTLSLVINLLGIRPYMTRSGIDLGALAAFALVWGFGGSLISLALSRTMAKWMQGVVIIEPQRAGDLSWLVQMVHEYAQRAKLPAMPEVGVYPGNEVNAFATGPTKSRSLVAVSAGMLRQMSRDEIEGVIGHEIAHIQNGDMVTLTLIQGVVNAFSIFLARVIAYVVAQAVSSRDEEGNFSPFVYSMVAFIADIFLTVLGSIVVCWFSRQREFRADAGCAQLCGSRNKMVSALRRLGRVYEGSAEEESVGAQPALAAMKIASGSGSSWSGFISLFRTHPPLADRIAALERGAL
jgi:heat shock protein HtpX